MVKPVTTTPCPLIVITGLLALRPLIAAVPPPFIVTFSLISEIVIFSLQVPLTLKVVPGSLLLIAVWRLCPGQVTDTCPIDGVTQRNIPITTNPQMIFTFSMATPSLILNVKLFFKLLRLCCPQYFLGSFISQAIK
jgi:hypothetical protein